MMARSIATVCFMSLAAACAKPVATPKPVVDEPARQRLDRAPTPPQAEDFEVISSVGTLSPEQVLDTVEPELGALMGCVQDHAQDAPWLGGDIELQWEVAPTGSVTAVVLRKSTLGSWASETCILQRAGVLVFPKPKGGPATVALPVEIPPAKRPLVLDSVRVRGVLVSGVTKLKKTCGAVPGEITATAYVGKRGQVLSVGFAGATPIDRTWAECALLEASQWVVAANRGYVSKLEFSLTP